MQISREATEKIGIEIDKRAREHVHQRTQPPF